MLVAELSRVRKAFRTASRRWKFGARYHKADEGGTCVEVAAHPAAIRVRDSKTPDAPHLTVNPPPGPPS
ncbi:DUF397 domain-containing protein [Actinomadura soli]|uniref:DUF397 domain-containing protein n=1 Tax=Actinomadura soli TaxID=2508997 RepID=UPI002E30AC62|nr:DUF397 domain-containing protein [Actinomadura soli]